MKNNKQGALIVLSGPSGVGKGTVCSVLLDKISNIQMSISYTTRDKRLNEKDGVNYFFTNEEKFHEMIDNADLLEYARVFGNYYGTSKKWIQKKIEDGVDILLELDTQGAFNVKKAFPDAVLIFLLPPSLKELKKRIHERGRETIEQVNFRLSRSKEEIKSIPNFDYIVYNESIDQTVDSIISIVNASRYRVKSDINGIIEKFNNEEIIC